jgi:hypothetical protein
MIEKILGGSKSGKFEHRLAIQHRTVVARRRHASDDDALRAHFRPDPFPAANIFHPVLLKFVLTLSARFVSLKPE